MIILKGNEGEYLTLNMCNILANITKIDSYIWKLLWIDGISHQINTLPFVRGMCMLEFEKYINNSSTGLVLSSRELLQLSTVFDDLIEIVIIGDNNESNLVKLENDDDMKSVCEYFIELVDSSYWEVTSKDDSFIKNIKRNFNYEKA